MSFYIISMDKTSDIWLSLPNSLLTNLSLFKIEPWKPDVLPYKTEVKQGKSVEFISPDKGLF